MVSDTVSGDSNSTGAANEGERAPNTFFNALIGAVASVLLGFVPFSPVLGGAVAGYLEGGDSSDGARVGAISGVLAAIPIIVVVVLVSTLLIIVPEGGAFQLSLLIIAIVLAVVSYTVLLSVIGGVLGVYINNEF